MKRDNTSSPAPIIIKEDASLVPLFRLLCLQLLQYFTTMMQAESAMKTQMLSRFQTASIVEPLPSYVSRARVLLLVLPSASSPSRSCLPACLPPPSRVATRVPAPSPPPPTLLMLLQQPDSCLRRLTQWASKHAARALTLGLSARSFLGSERSASLLIQSAIV